MLLTEYNEQEHMAMERKEWYEIGQTDGLKDGILEILAFRGVVPDEIRQLIVNQTDLDVLKIWHRKAIAAASISDFLQSLNQN